MNTTLTKQIEPKTVLLAYKQQLDKELSAFLQEKVEAYKKISPFASGLMANVAEFTLRGGKRLRPALLYYTYKLFGGTNDQETIKISMFIELLESFLLIHDDIMDRALLRRGGPALHKTYETFSQENGFHDDAHFGTIMGILGGDLANELALEIISKANFPEHNKNELYGMVGQEISNVIFGQCHDVLLDYDYPKGFQDEDIVKVHIYKTATYTFRLPMFAGAILAGATKAEVAELDRFAIPCGIAFQIQDDVLGVFGDVKVTGKDVASDLTEGKKTLLVTYADRFGTEAQKQLLKQYLGKKDLTESEADQIRQIFKETGSLEHSRSECLRYIERAKNALAKFSDKNQEAYQTLVVVADYMAVRNV